MSSREKILAAVKKNQPTGIALPEEEFTSAVTGDVQRFETVLQSIGGTAYRLKGGEDIIARLEQLFPDAKRFVSADTTVERYLLAAHKDLVHHSLHDVDVAIIKAKWAVAENGAVWVEEEDLKIRVLPFICEHLVVLLDAKNIVATVPAAYEKIGQSDYGFGVFIAGPSKTADIEQSLVLGAHGPKSMTVLLLNNAG